MTATRPRKKTGPKPDATRRKKFVAIYLADPKRNGTEAALQAGFATTRGAAGVQARRLLKETAIAKAIAEADQQVVDFYELTRERIVRELAFIALSNPMDYGKVVDGHYVLDLSQTTREQMAAVTELESHAETTGDGKKAITTRETKIKLRGKREALIDAARMMGYLRDEGPPPAHVTFNIVGLVPEEQINGERRPGPRERAARRLESQSTVEFSDPARR